MKTYTPKEVEQLLKEQRELCAIQAPYKYAEDIFHAPLPSSFQKVEEVEGVTAEQPNNLEKLIALYKDILADCKSEYDDLHYSEENHDRILLVRARMKCYEVFVKRLEEYASSVAPKHISEEEMYEKAEELLPEYMKYSSSSGWEYSGSEVDEKVEEGYKDGFVAGYKEAITKQ